MPPSTHFSRLLLAQLSFPQQSKRSGYHRDSYRGGLDKQTHAPYKGFKPSPIATSYSCARRFLVGFCSSEFFFSTAAFQPPSAARRAGTPKTSITSKPAAKRKTAESKCRFTDLRFSLPNSLPKKCMDSVKALCLAEYRTLYRYSLIILLANRNSYF